MLKWAAAFVFIVIGIVAASKQGAAQNTCMVTFDRDYPVYSSPLLISDLTAIQPGVPYEVLRTIDVPNQIHVLEIRLDATTTGWIHAYSMINTERRGDCSAQNERQPFPFDEFPNLCQYTLDEPTMVFADSALTRVKSLDIYSSSGSLYLTTFRSELVVGVYYGSEAPTQFDGYLPVHQVTFTLCQPIVYEPSVTATMNADTQMWSIPYTAEGTVKADIPSGTVLRVFAGPTLVNNVEWYLLSHEQYGKGWVQSSQLELSAPFPPPIIDTRRVLPGAEMWTQPNTETGSSKGAIASGATVHLLQGPVNDFYFVKTLSGCCSGWLSAEFIAPPGWEPTSTPIPTETTVPTITPTLPADPIGAGMTVIRARLWDAPDAQTGNSLLEIDKDQRLKIWRGPVEGSIRSDGSVLGDWYYVEIADGTRGWMWAGSFDFLAPNMITPTVDGIPLLPTETPLAESIGRATALSDARLWSEPNAQTGNYVGDLPEGAELQILEGPVQGPIRADGSLTGDWYLVATLSRDQSGWVWVLRIAIHPE